SVGSQLRRALRPRCLHDSGRQSSLDSGIGITTGSQSSFSSRTASLEMTGQGAGEEYCSPTSLPPPPPHPPSSPPCAPTLTPPPLSYQLPEQTSASSCSGASRRHSAEYQIPSLLRLWYETPRRLLQPQSQPPAPPVMGRAENRGSAGGVQVQTSLFFDLSNQIPEPQAFMSGQKLTFESGVQRRCYDLSQKAQFINPPPPC
uniref:Uncharacterized protein n=1 Tax=Oryzias sinensis TaxID=183150 RepID=A0A8C7WYY0_9TELE